MAIDGIPLTRMGPVAADAPNWTVLHEVGATGGRHLHLDDRWAEISMADGSTLTLEREDAGGSARLVTPVPLDPAELAHPHLAPLGTVTAYWRGWLAMHAGAFVVDGRAWLIPAVKESGKTTTLAQAGVLGLPVVCDDIAVVDTDLHIHAGPRFVDLRPDVAERLGWGDPVGHLGLRERWRMSVDDCEPTYPIGGFVFPAFGDETIRRMPASQAISRMLDSVLIKLPGERAQLAFDAITSTICVEWHRPRDVDTLERSVGRLVVALG